MSKVKMNDKEWHNFQCDFLINVLQNEKTISDENFELIKLQIEFLEVQKKVFEKTGKFLFNKR